MNPRIFQRIELRNKNFKTTTITTLTGFTGRVNNTHAQTGQFRQKKVIK